MRKLLVSSDITRAIETLSNINLSKLSVEQANSLMDKANENNACVDFLIKDGKPVGFFFKNEKAHQQAGKLENWWEEQLNSIQL